MAWKGLMWIRVTRKSLEWPNVAQSSAERTREDLKCAKMAQGGLEWSEVVKSGPECTRVDPK